MNLLAGWRLVLAGAIVAGWLGAMMWAVAAAVVRQREAGAAAARLRELEALAALCPSQALLVCADDRLEGPVRLARWLGFDALPDRLDMLDAGDRGLDAGDLAGLRRAVETTRRTAAGFTLRAGVQGSDRRLRIIGEPAPGRVGRPGAVLIWMFDSTESGRTIRRLAGEVEDLRGSLDALAALIEAAPIPMWHRGSDLRLSLVNSAYVRAVEAGSAGEVIARGLELVEGTGEANPLVSAAAAREQGQVQQRSAPATIAGERRMLHIVDVPLGSAGVAGYAVDVEELEQARADLSRFGRAQRDLLDRLSAGVAQFGNDHSLVFFNQPFARLFALKPDWLADHPEFDRMLERMREAGRLPESRDFPTWKTERRAWFTAHDQPVEENWLLPGGSHLRVVAQPLPDGGLLLIFEDRTEQLRLASARDTLLRVRTATFDNLFEAVGVFAADGRLSIWNNRFRDVWGIEEEVLARHPRVDALVEVVARKLSNPARASLIRELVRLATVERQQRSGRVQLTDGRHFEFAVVPLPDGNALFTMLDVTDSRRVEAALRDSNAALEEADRVKTAFVAGMSYELRTPLTSIGGFAEMLAGGYAGELAEPQRDYVAAILTSVQRLGAVIDDVLHVTQAAAGMLPAGRAPVRIAELVREAAETADRRAEGRGIIIGLRIDPLTGTVEGDGARLSEALAHALDHAVSRTAPGARVEVTASGTAETAEILVRDEGPRIEAGDQARLVTRFAAPPREDEEAEIASFRGLAAARLLVEAHGGMLTVGSGEERGAVVTITLPRVQPDA